MRRPRFWMVAMKLPAGIGDPGTGRGPVGRRLAVALPCFVAVSSTQVDAGADVAGVAAAAVVEVVAGAWALRPNPAGAGPELLQAAAARARAPAMAASTIGCLTGSR